MITMRCLLLFLFHVLFLCVGNIDVYLTPSFPSLTPTSAVSYDLYETKDVPTVKRIVFTDRVISRLLILILWVIILQYKVWLHMCRNTHYVPFDTNLNLFKKNKSYSILTCSHLWFTSAGLALVLLSEYETDFIQFLLAVMSPSFELLPCFELMLYLLSKFKKTLSFTFFVASVFLIFTISTTPSAQYVCVLVLQISCISFAKESPPWMSTLLILISNDIEQNPGPGYHKNFFNFMNWNLNSLATNDFARVQLIEAHNSLHNYDLISICETSLTDSLAPNVPELDGYTFEPANHPDNVTHGGVGLFYKNSLPIVIRRDLSFNESIVTELKFGFKK